MVLRYLFAPTNALSLQRSQTWGADSEWDAVLTSLGAEVVSPTSIRPGRAQGRVPGRDGVPRNGWLLRSETSPAFYRREEQPLDWLAGRRALDSALQSAPKARAQQQRESAEEQIVKAISSLPQQPREEKDTCFECSLCLTEVGVGEDVRVLGCQHAFHTECERAQV